MFSDTACGLTDALPKRSHQKLVPAGCVVPSPSVATTQLHGWRPLDGPLTWQACYLTLTSWTFSAGTEHSIQLLTSSVCPSTFPASCWASGTCSSRSRSSKGDDLPSVYTLCVSDEGLQPSRISIRVIIVAPNPHNTAANRGGEVR